MLLRRLFLLGVVAWAWVAIGARAASACGEWSLTDTQRKASVSYYVSTANVAMGKKRGVFWIVEAAGGIQASDGKRVVVDVKDGAIVHRKKKIGTLAADGTAVIKGRTYTIALLDPHPVHGMPGWNVEVRLGDAVIATGEAMSLCAAMHREPPLTTAQLEDEVRRRVLYYLVWRDSGGKL